MFRLLAVPALAVAGVLIYRGAAGPLHAAGVRFFARQGHAHRRASSSSRSRPLRMEPIKTISTSNAEVVCNALLPC